MKEMSGISRLLSSGCKLMSLSAVLSFLYLSPTYSADQVIAKGETVDGAVGTKDNILKISGTSNNAVIEGSGYGVWHEVLSGGFANDTIVNNGNLRILSGGVSKDTTVNKEGCLNVWSGGVADNTTVNYGGEFYVHGVANGTIINEGDFEVTASGIVNDTVINKTDIYAWIKGSANNTTINGGSVRVIGKMNNTIVNGGSLDADYWGGDKAIFDTLVINEGASFYLSTNSTITNATIYGRDVSLTDHQANGWLLKEGGELTVKSGGTSQDILVDGGTLAAASNSIVRDTIVKKGKISSSSGALVDGLVIEKGAHFNLDTASTVINAKQDGKDVSISNNVARGWTFYDGDNINLNNGTIEDVVVAEGGYLSFYEKSGTLKNIEVSSGGRLSIRSPGSMVVEDIFLREGAFLDLYSSSTNLVVKGLYANNLKDIRIDGADRKRVFLENVEVNYANVSIPNEYKNIKINISREDAQDMYFRGLIGESLSEEEQKEAENVEILVSIADEIMPLYPSVNGFKTTGDTSLQNSAGVYRKLKNIFFSQRQLLDLIGKESSLSTEEEIIEYYKQYAGIYYDMAVAGKEILDEDSVAVGNFLFLKNADVENMAIAVNEGNDIRLGKGGYLLTVDSVIDRLALTDGAGFSLTTGDTITNSTQEGKDVSIADGIAKGWTIHDGSSLTVMAGHEADDTVVEKGGELSAAATARLNNMLAAGGAILNLEDGVVLTGDIVVDKDADVSGSTFDFSNIFAASNTDAKSLTVTGGVNEAFTDKLVNEEPNEDKSLTLAGGSYSIADVVKAGSTQVAGWDVINIKATESAPATIVKLESDIGLSGSNKEMIVGEGAVLDVSGHSPLNITIDGNLINSGVIDFTVMDRFGEADDSVTVTGDYIARDGALMVLNIEPENGTADRLIVDGDVKGNTNLYLKTSSDRKADGDILFAEVPNDNPDTASSFEVWRVEGSPYEWSTKFADNKWWTYVSGESNQYVPEVVAYMGLYDAAFEQTRSFVRALSSNSGNNGVLGTRCQYGRCYHLTPAHTAWAVPVYEKAEIQAPYEYDAKITGLDAGIDLAADGVNKVGVTASYRKGRYDFSGYGKDAFAKAGARTDIDSYLLGLYYRRDKDHFRIVTAAYGGIQKADMRSDDGVKAESDAKEYGITLDVAYIYEAVKGITFEPEMQVSWTMLDYDDIKDNVGKTYKMETAQRVEAEVGLKIRKSWEFDAGRAALYIKPSIIRTYHFGGEFALTDERKIKALRDETLGRVEAGAEVVVNARWSVGASVAHTFGSDYKETSANLDLKYRF